MLGNNMQNPYKKKLINIVIKTKLIIQLFIIKGLLRKKKK